MNEQIGAGLTVSWKYFSLEQANNQQDSHWKIWEHAEDYPSRGLRAFWAAEAARKQGEAKFYSFHIALLKARHEKRRDIADINTLLKVGKSVNLEMSKFQKDLSDVSLLARLGEDHTFAIEELGIFGTPTLVFPERQAVFLKMSSIPASKECVSFFTELVHFVNQRQYIQEIKRCQPPQ